MSSQGLVNRTELRRLLAVLVQEQNALRGADLGRLNRLAPRKAALLDRIEQTSHIRSADKPLLEQVRSVAARNGALLEAVLAGLKSARQMLEGLQRPERSQAYARDGQRYILEIAEAKLQRRA